MASIIPSQIFVLLLICDNLFQSHFTSAQESCQASAWPPHRPDGNVRFTLLLSKNIGNFDQDLSQTCELTSFALQHYLAVEWLVDRLNLANNNNGYIPGITIGFDGLNDCSLPKLAARNGVSVYNDYSPYVSTSSTCTNQDRNSTHAGFIMVSKSAVAREVASIMSDSSVPIISATATLAELSNRQLYPNFLRTVPSDIHQMTFIADILETLHWSYIVVAYQDSLYGTSGLADLQQKAQDKGICIHKSLMLPLDSFGFTREFNNIINTAKDQSITVVVIADILRTRELLCALRGTSMSMKFHFILTEAVNKYVFEGCMDSSWTFTISTDPDIELKDLKSYINEKYRGEQSKGSTDEKHPVIAEYLKLDDSPKTGNLVDGALAPYITSTINAVFALMESVRILHDETCAGRAELCAEMISKMTENRLLELVSSNTINYRQTESGVIPNGLQNISFTFDKETGEIIHLSNFNQYTVYYFSNQEYTNVGDFSNGLTQLSLSKVMSLSSGPMPTSVCAGRCDTCLHNGKIPIVFVPGDVYIVGVLSIHEPNLFDCGAWRKTGNDAFVAEGFIYAIDLLYQKTGIKFGAIGIDDCYSPLRIMSLLTDYMSNINPSNNDLFPFHVPREEIIGAIGCRSSGCTLATASVFMPQRIPLISYGASSPDLDDRVNYPYFLRTVPSDVFQAQVMVDIIKKMGWEYVGLLYVKNNYGSKGMLAFRDIVDKEGSGICVPKEFGISEENNEQIDKDMFFNAYIHFRTLQVKVVVFFGIDERFKSFIESMEVNNRHGNFIFLASEEWGKNRKILNAGIKAARGSITLKLQEVGVESKDSFKRYLKTKQPSSNDTNIWFKEFWQNQFNCNFKGGLINEFESDCDGTTLVDDQIEELVSEQRLSHVMNAVFAMGNAFKSIKDNQCKGQFPCEYLSSTPEGVVEEIMTQTISNGQQVHDLFDEYGNGAIGFDVFNIQTNDGGQSYDYVQVGTFPGSEELNEDQLKFYDASGNTITIQASCSGTLCNTCQHRFVPTVPSPGPAEDEEKSDSDYKDSDILIISLIIVLIIAIAIIVAAFVLCFKRKYKDIEKKMASNDHDQIYAQVYPGNYNTSANRLRFSDPNFSPYLDSNPSGGGLSNHAYAPDSDNVDSVSQAAMRRQNRSNTNNFGPQISDDSDSTTQRNPVDQQHDASGPMLHYPGRPLPSTAIGRGRANSYDSDAAPPRSSNASSASLPQGFRGSQNDAAQVTGRYLSPSQISLNVPSSSQQDPNSNRFMLRMPYSATSEMVSSTNQGEEPVIYYIRDANGQLAALVPSSSITRASVRSDASSSVIADHGPYSDALAQKKAMLRGQIPENAVPSSYTPQALISMPVQSALAPNAGAQHENLELQEMSQSQPRPHRSHTHAQAVVVEMPLSNNSPIHYASPVHNPKSGLEGGAAPGHQPLPYQGQATAIPMGDPNVNHFRQNSDAYRKQDHFVAREDLTGPVEQLTRSAVGHINMADVERDDDQRHTEPSSAVPDVVSSNPSHPPAQGHHSGSSSEEGKAAEKPKELSTDVTFLQNSQGQQMQAVIPSTISTV